MTSRVELFRDPSKLSSVSRDICAQLYRILRRAPVRDVGPTPQHLTAELVRVGAMNQPMADATNEVVGIATAYTLGGYVPRVRLEYFQQMAPKLIDVLDAIDEVSVKTVPKPVKR